MKKMTDPHAEFIPRLQGIINRTIKLIDRQVKEAMTPILARVEKELTAKDLADYYELLNTLVDLFDGRLTRSEIIRIYNEGLGEALAAGAQSTVNENIKVDVTLDDPIDRNFYRYLRNTGKQIIVRYFGALGNKLHQTLTTVFGRKHSWEKAKRELTRIFDYSNRRAETIVRTELARGAVGARLNQYDKSEVVSHVEWFSGPEDNCGGVPGFPKGTICQDLHGRTFTIDEARGLIPSHPNCFSKDTEIYTSNGWLTYDEIKTQWKELTFLSLNPNSFDLEWVEAVNFIDYHYVGEMIHFKSKTMDSLVTPNHQVFVGQRNKLYDRKHVTWRLRDAEEVTDGRFYKSSKWVGKEPELMLLGDKTISSETYCKFMGYYLSEGSTTKRSEKHYQIAIGQHKNESYEKIWNDLSEIKKKYKAKGYIGFSGAELGKYLIKFGKSYEKFIPADIKKLSPRLIRIFLDAYLLGDGSVRKNVKQWKNGKFVYQEKVYFTSSKKMADDLGELLIKVGRGISFYLDKTTGKKVKFKNGVYTINHDCWKINELKNVHNGVKPAYRFIVDYNDIVYDVELQKHHVLLTRRNNKVIWSGNCRCLFIPVVE
jgi:hypothetical protein